MPRMKQLLGGRSNNEILDSISSSRLARALSPLTLVGKRNSLLSLHYENTKILAPTFAYARSEQIEGDYAEFGVWTGRTFVEAWRAGNAFPVEDRRFVAFDSFEGLPEVEGADDTGRWAAGEFSADRKGFEARLRRAGVPKEQVHIVEGFFDATLAAPERIPLEKVAIAWVDCDLYSSTVPVLDYLTPRLSQGAILIFDDWFCFKGDPQKGEARACAEWLERNPQITLVPWRQYNFAGQAFIVRRADAADE
jgi:O-methyltransferase